MEVSVKRMRRVYESAVEFIWVCCDRSVLYRLNDAETVADDSDFVSHVRSSVSMFCVRFTARSQLSRAPSTASVFSIAE